MKPRTRIVIAAAGGLILVWAVKHMLGKKRVHTLPFGYGMKLKKSVTINRPASDLYRFWRNLENLPRFLDHLESVKVIDDKRSRWVMSAPGGFRLEWDAQITADRSDHMIGWRSLKGADIDNAGYVRFERAAGGRGTTVRVALQYNLPAGKVGAALSTLLGEKPQGQIEEALRKFKNLMEAGEIPQARMKAAEHPEAVEVASEDSFPASDAPAWTGTTGP
jgi:uncharacterized membrane protein